VPTADALTLAKEFFRGVTISDEIIANAKERDETRFKTEIDAVNKKTEEKPAAKEKKDAEKTA